MLAVLDLVAGFVLATLHQTSPGAIRYLNILKNERVG
jgi:hypothetical protein